MRSRKSCRFQLRTIPSSISTLVYVKCLPLWLSSTNLIIKNCTIQLLYYFFFSESRKFHAMARLEHFLTPSSLQQDRSVECFLLSASIEIILENLRSINFNQRAACEKQPVKSLAMKETSAHVSCQLAGHEQTTGPKWTGATMALETRNSDIFRKIFS